MSAAAPGKAQRWLAGRAGVESCAVPVTAVPVRAALLTATLLTASLAASLALPAGPLATQPPPPVSAANPGGFSGLQMEVRGGLTVGSHSASAAALDIAPQLSFEALVKKSFTPRLSAFAGFARTAFGCEEGFCRDKNISIVGNHGVLGGELNYGTPWLRGALLFGTTRAGEEGEDPEVGVGFQFGAGLSIGSGKFRFLPGASYRWLSASTASASDHASALSLELGFGYALGGGGS